MNNNVNINTTICTTNKDRLERNDEPVESESNTDDANTRSSSSETESYFGTDESSDEYMTESK